MSLPVVNACISQEEYLDVLSKKEVTQLLDTSQSGLYKLFRRCCLAVLNCGTQTDDVELLEEQYKTFDIALVSTERGVKLSLHNAPASAFVDGEIIRGISEHLFSVVRDIIYVNNEIIGNKRFDLLTSADVTDAVFHILRNAGLLFVDKHPRMVVCWGGHSISHNEYIYTKKVGYELGLRGMDICTGCGPGAMKGPMKGGTIGHAEQRRAGGQYLGITEPGIIAAESPNPIVNRLVIMPDIEKRLEAFLRVGHGVIVFPGGAGTMEEILYILGVLLHEDNAEIPFPLVMTGPECSKGYFELVDKFLTDTLGRDVCGRYKIIIAQPDEVARYMSQGISEVKEYRKKTGDAYYFNWRLTVPASFQTPFVPTHESVKNEIVLSRNLSTHELTMNLRKVFSAIVAGNVKEEGVRVIKEKGPFKIAGDSFLLSCIDQLLKVFIGQGRMKLPGGEYKACYDIVKN